MNRKIQKIVIVGGVAGGAACAARLRRLSEDTEIIIFERGPYVSFANCGLPYFVGDVIKEEKDLIVASPELFRDRFAIEVRTPKSIVIVDGDTRLPLVVTATTVDEALTSAGVSVGQRDRVEPAPRSTLADGDTVTIERFTTKKRTEVEAVPFRTVTRETDELYTDEQRVEQDGQPGERRLEICFRPGKNTRAANVVSAPRSCPRTCFRR